LLWSDANSGLDEARAGSSSCRTGKWGGCGAAAPPFAGYAGEGRVKAALGVDPDNPTQAARLYRTVGMTPQYEANIYQRTLAAAR
jgi:hypothetical protein